MELEIDFERIEKCVRKFENKGDLLCFIKNTLDYLYTHNKNYNQQQWIKIQDLYEIFDSIKNKYN